MPHCLYSIRLIVRGILALISVALLLVGLSGCAQAVPFAVEEAEDRFSGFRSLQTSRGILVWERDVLAVAYRLRLYPLWPVGGENSRLIARMWRNPSGQINGDFAEYGQKIELLVDGTTRVATRWSPELYDSEVAVRTQQIGSEVSGAAHSELAQATKVEVRIGRTEYTLSDDAVAELRAFYEEVVRRSR